MRQQRIFKLLRRWFGHRVFTRKSRRKARSLDTFCGPPAILFDRPGKEGLAERWRERIEPFFAAFEKERQSRLDLISRARQELDAGPVVVSMFNWGYRQMVENWAASCDHHDIDCRAFTLLFPTDAKADEFARQLGFQTIYVEESYGAIPVEANDVFGDMKFRRVLFAKLAVTKDMLDLGYDILRQDVDVVWSCDPRDEIIRLADRDSLDMLFMFDGPNVLYEPLHYNTGFVFIRSNPFTRHAWNVVFSNYSQIFDDGGEQRVVNEVIDRLRQRGLRTDQLPENTYVNGHVISRAMREGTGLPEQSVVVHASWTSDIKPKVDHMKQFGLWHLQPIPETAEHAKSVGPGTSTKSEGS